MAKRCPVEISFGRGETVRGVIFKCQRDQDEHEDHEFEGVVDRDAARFWRPFKLTWQMKPKGQRERRT